jgi:hypothetical protein
VEPAAHAALPYATPAIIVNLVRLTDRRRAVVLTGLFAVLGTRPWDPSWDITPLGVVNTVLPALAVLYLRARRELVDSLRERAERAEREQPALAELRDLVGVLRNTDAMPVGEPVRPVAPDPWTLVVEARAVNETVSYAADGDPEQIAPTVLRTAYRVVQESLTNARKHAPGAEVTVTMSYRPDGVAVCVANGAASRAPRPVGARALPASDPKGHATAGEVL